MILIDTEIDRLAIGCLYILYHRAIVSFPTSTKAHPSYLVFVHRSANSTLREGDNWIFPYQVAWFVWESSIYPVIKSYWHRDLSQFGSPSSLIALLKRDIKNLLMKNGYWPKDETYVDPASLPEDNGEYPGLYGNVWWLRLNFKYPEDINPE